MQCPQCHHENPGDAKFCLECGRRLALSCGGCGIELPAGAKFCKECGQAVGAATSPTAARVGAPPESYTPKHLAEKILISKAALEGERKQVTVLFADLKGSMELLADRDPEEARKILDPVLERMMEAVHRYEGTLNQVMGDGIMALFGAPLAHEDHAVRACYAALRMQESVKAYADGVRRTERMPIQIRVGLNSGEVVVRSISSDLHMDYTAVGQTTHLAARMEQAATPGSILLTANTLAIAEGYVTTRSVGRLPVKGLPEPIQAYELVNTAAIRTPLQAALTRGLTPFVGRAGEIVQLQQTLDLARAGRGQAVALVGEAGVGKSRVLWEFSHSDSVVDLTLLEANCISHGTNTPYLATIDLLRSYFHISSLHDTPAIIEQVRSTIRALDPALLSELPALLSVLNVATDDEGWRELDPLHRRPRIIEAIRRVLFHGSRKRPLLIVVEDLHWIDSETQIVLDALVESLPRSYVLLLLTYRPEYRHNWINKTYYSQLRIDPLHGASGASLLGAILGDDPLLDPLKQRLNAWTEGNPFFVEQTVRGLVETKALLGHRGSYTLVRPIIELELPGTLQTLLAARIDRLRPEDKRVLQIAAVIGSTVPLPLLRDVAELPEPDLRASLARLQAGEFLDEERLLPEEEYAFRHAVTHDVAYRGLIGDHRHDFHRRVAAVLEGASPDRLSQHMAALAQHSVRGELWDKAVTYSSQAGIQAVELGALREAATWFEQALLSLAHIPESESATTTGIDLRFAVRNMLSQYGDLRNLLPRLEEARDMALQVKDERRRTRATTYIAEHFFLVGNQDRALEYGEAALASARKLGSAGLLLEATTHLGMICHAIGQYARSAELLRANILPASSEVRKRRFANPALLSNYSRSWLVWNFAELGLFEEALKTGEDGVREADALEHPFYRVVAGLGLGIAAVRRGDWTRARAVLEEAVTLSRGGGGFPSLFAASAGWLASAYAFSGRLADARALHLEGINQALASGLTVFEPLRQTQLAETLVLSGRIDDAHETAESAVTVAKVHGERGHEAWALRLLGDAAFAKGASRLAIVEAYCRGGLILAEELGMRPLVAHCHLGLGKLYRRADKREQAQEHLTTAATMYREMGMRFWLEQAEEQARGLL